MPSISTSLAPVMYFEITTGWSRLTLGVDSGAMDLFAANDGEAALVVGALLTVAS